MPGPSLAVLGIKVENGEVVKATASLDKMTVAGGKTEAATQRLTRRMALAEIEARKMDAALGQTSRTAELAARAFTAFSAIAVVGFIGRETIKNTIEAQHAMAQLEAAVESTGGVAGRTVAELDAMSMALQRTTTFSDEQVKSAQSMLLTFDKIRGTEFDRATAAVTDLAARMGGDLQGAAVQVGKALQDPTTGLTALRRSGVSFSESQIAVIKTLYETGRAAEGQRVILAELEHQFGGSAKAARDTFGGALTGLKNAFGDLFEVTRGGSQGTVDAMNAITRSLETSGLSMNTFVTNTVVGWNNISAAVQKAKNWMTVDLSQGLGAAADHVRALNEQIERERIAANARAMSTAKSGPAAGTVGVVSAEQTQAAVAAAKKQHEANLDLIRDAEQMAEMAGMDAKDQARARIEYDATNKAIDAQRRLKGALLDETLAAIEKEKGLRLLGLDRATLRDELKGAQADIEQFMSQMASTGLQSWSAFFDSVGALTDKLMARLKTLGKEGGSAYKALGAIGIAIAGGAAGYQTGQQLYSTSHGAAGNYARGALGGAASGALAGAMMGSAIGPIGAAAGAAIGGITGFVGGLFGVGSAAKAAAKQMAAAQETLRLSMQGLKATVSGDALDVAIAQIEAEREKYRRDYEDAYAGGKNERERYRLIGEMNALENKRIQMLKEEYAVLNQRKGEDFHVRYLRAMGFEKEADAEAFANSQQRERADLVKGFGDTIDAMEAYTLSQYDAAAAAEAIAFATGQATNALDKFGGGLNMVSGYKYQDTVFGAMTARLGVEGMRQALEVTIPVTLVMPNGQVLGAVVIDNFADRKAHGDAKLKAVLQ